ncbi:calcium-binding protein [Paenibacillus tepidiphilus]|uniref:calcium-binding protein n=1 Tax=Paenibacillus tepidiphilus TaxID=2608683 RepID=UPI0013A5AFDA|nr:calcium-binding protein [Paenibacillus tepidiphilus]
MATEYDLMRMAHLAYFPLNEIKGVTIDELQSDEELANSIINYEGKSIQTVMFDNNVTSLLDMNDWKIVDSISNEQTVGGFYGVAFLNEKTDEIVIACRGTEGKGDAAGIKDIVNDAMLAMNYKTKQEMELKLFIEHVADKYNGSISITGHSLGGYLAQVGALELMDNYNSRFSKAVTFNAAGVYSPAYMPFPEVHDAIVGALSEISNLVIANYGLDSVQAQGMDLIYYYFANPTFKGVTKQQWENNKNGIYDGKVRNYVVSADVVGAAPIFQDHIGSTIILPYMNESKFFGEHGLSDNFYKYKYSEEELTKDVFETADSIKGTNGRDWIYGGGGDDNLQSYNDSLFDMDYLNLAFQISEMIRGMLGENEPVLDLFGEYKLEATLTRYLYKLDNALENTFAIDQDDHVFGGKGDDLIKSGAGNDYLEGGSGNDTIHGGKGDDTYVYSKNDGSDSIYEVGKDVNDTLIIKGYSLADILVKYDSKTDLLVFTFSGEANDKITVYNWLTGAGSLVNRIEKITLDDGNAYDFANAFKEYIEPIVLNNIWRLSDLADESFEARLQDMIHPEHINKTLFIRDHSPGDAVISRNPFNGDVLITFEDSTELYVIKRSKDGSRYINEYIDFIVNEDYSVRFRVEEFVNGKIAIDFSKILNFEAILAYYEYATQLISPIILDLDDDGIETSGVSEGVYFDLDGNGFAEKTGWTGSDDGLLVLDRDGNGLIETGRELFGDQTMLQNGSKAQHGFEALSELDANDDGKIDIQDAAYSKLRIWKDENNDGISSSDELFRLDQLDIKSLSTGYVTVNKTESNKNILGWLGSYEKLDGNINEMGDYLFNRDRTDSKWIQSVALTKIIEELPDIIGSGNVASLHQTMASDATGTLIALVQRFINESNSDLIEQRALVEEIIYEWSGSAKVVPGSRGTYIDSKKLTALEHFLGIPFVQKSSWGASPGPMAGKTLEECFSDLLDKYQALLISQTYVKDLTEMLYYKNVNGKMEMDFTAIQGRLLTELNADPPVGKRRLEMFSFVLHEFKIFDYVDKNSFRSFFYSLNKEWAAIFDAQFLSNNMYSSNTVYGTSADDYLMGVLGDDSLLGGSGNDSLDGRWGDDYLEGGTGNDIYIFGRGYGMDTIYDNDSTAGNVDVIRFKDDILPEDITLIKSGNHLELRVNGTTDKLIVNDYLVSGGSNAIERIQFADGTIWDPAYIREATCTITGSSSADILTGNADNDTLDGGSGNDTLQGGTGNDTYIFGRGYGVDTIYENDGTAANIDVIQFKNDILPEDIILIKNGNHLELRVNGTTDKLVVNNYLVSGGNYVIERLQFADGTVWDPAYIRDTTRTITGSSSADTLTGNADNDKLFGLEGNDYLYGQAGNDLLDGGAGNDQLYGGDRSNSPGNDTYIFGRGYGVDTVYDYDGTAGNVDVIQFKDDILPEDIILTKNGDNLELRVNGTTDKLVVNNYLVSGGKYAIEHIQFANGTVWDLVCIKETTRMMLGSTSNDTLTGNADNDTLDGGMGNDTLQGGAGNDTYIFGRGYGTDTIYDNDGTAGNIDVIQFKDDILPEDITLIKKGDHLELRVNGTTDKLVVNNYLVSGGKYAVERIQFANGTIWDLAYIKDATRTITGSSSNDTLIGNADNDTIDGGMGSDTLQGGAGNDTYIFGRGYGVDTIYDKDSTAGNVDVIQFKDDILPEDITLIKNGDHLELRVNGTTDKLVVNNYLVSGGSYAIERIQFADGTIWDPAYIREATRTIIGSSSADTLTGNTDNDTLDGRMGSDTLQGWAGNDTYIFGRGYGVDTIYDYDNTAGNVDVIQFKDDILPEDITLIKNGDHLELRVNGTTDKLVVNNYLVSGGKYVIERIQFANRTVWDSAYIKETTRTMLGSTSNDTLTGNADNDTLDGRSGNDTLQGGAGNDTYIFGRGYGVDTIYDYDSTTGNVDIIRFKDDILPEDIILTKNGDDLELRVSGTADKLVVNNYLVSGGEYAIERIQFANGTVWDSAYIEETTRTMLGSTSNDTLTGNADNDTLDGGSGNDILKGGAGSDTYIFGRGYGVDTIYDYDNTGGNVDIIRFKDDILPEDIILTKNADDLELRVSGTADKLVVSCYLASGGRYAIDRIQFANGTVWDSAYIKETTRMMLGSSSNDTLTGNADNDTLDGGIGNDSLRGGAGNDTYIFGRGYGMDTIYDYDSTAGNVDVIQFKDDILPEDIILTKNGDNLELRVNGTADKLVVSNYLASGGKYAIERIQFADGTVWDSTYIKETTRTMLGSASNDTLTGNADNDTLDGRSGNDSLQGGVGNDTYIFGRGYGVDTIYDYDSTAGNVDVIQFKNDILPEDIKVQKYGNDLELSINGTADKLVVSNYLASGGSYAIEHIQFANGTVWDSAYIKETTRTMLGSISNDTLIGNADNDTLDGRSGNDSLQGGAGNDTYIFGRGYGLDTIYDFDSKTGNVDIIQFKGDILPEDIILTKNGNNLELKVSGTADKLFVSNSLASGGSYAIERIQFANGTVWDSAYIKETTRTMLGSTSNDTLTGNADNDILDGRLGNDNLQGGAGNDTYIFGRGYGVDTINDNDSTAGNVDVIQFKEDVLPSDILLKKSGDDLELSINGTTDRVFIRDYFSAGGRYTIERIHFADGTQWDFAYIKEITRHMIGTGSNDILTGNAFDDILDGRSGNDYLDGRAGNDTYIFGRGYGSDRIYDNDSTAGNRDIIQFKDDILPEDIILTKNEDHLNMRIKGTEDSLFVNNYFSGGGNDAIEQFQFGNGTVWDFAYIKEKARYIVGSEVMDDTLTGNADNDLLFGLGGNDNLIGKAGDDVLDGGSGEDELHGGDNYWADEVAGNDTYIFGRGYGVDTIYDNDSTAGNIDVIRFKDDILPSDVVLQKSSDNLLLSINGSSDKLIVNNFFYGDGNHMIERIEFTDGTVWDLAFIKTKTARIVGSDLDDELYGNDDNDNIVGLGGNDLLFAGGGDDVLEGSSGDDTIVFGTGNDLMIYNVGDGHDTVENWDYQGWNTLSFGRGITPEDVSIIREGSNLIFKVLGNTGSVTIDNFYFHPQLNQVKFEDGTLWTYEDIYDRGLTVLGTSEDDQIDGLYGINDKLYGLGGNDELNGHGGDDVLDGGAGNDTLYGGEMGAVQFVFGRGYGKDTVVISDWDNSNIATIKLLVNPADIEVGVNNNSLVLAIKGTNDQLIVDSYFTGESKKIEQVVFLDGTVWTREDTLAQLYDFTVLGTVDSEMLEAWEDEDSLLYGFNGNDNLIGKGRNDVLYGGNGYDNLYGGAGNDVLDGGSGNDLLYGNQESATSPVHSGNDTYVFGKGYGNDIVYDYDVSTGNIDTIQLLVDPEEIEIYRETNNLIFRIKETNEQMTVNYYYSSGNDYKVERVLFANGTEWSQAELESNLIIRGTQSDNWLYGYYGINDKIYGLEGNDTLSGYSGHDVLDGGTGNDTLYGMDDNDTLYGGAGTDQLDGGEGDDVLFGEAGNDLLIGGKGSDILNPGKGTNRIIYNRGDGIDTIIAGDNTGVDGDTEYFNYNWGWKATQDWNGSYWSDGGNDAFDNFGSTTIRFAGVSSGIYFGAADGVTRETVVAGNTFATRARFLSDNILELFIKQNTENALFSVSTGGNLGSDGREQFEVRTVNIGGNEVRYAHSKDLSGSDPDVYLFIIPESSVGSAVNYTRNNDNIYGSTADMSGAVRILIIPTYLGFQTIQDLLRDNLFNNKARNSLSFGEGITPENVLIVRRGNDLVLITSAEGEVAVSDWYSGNALEKVEFSNGTVWSASEVEANVKQEIRGTEEVNEIMGSDNDEIIFGLGADDIIYGNGGADIIDGGGNEDVIYGGAGNDKLRNGAYLFGDQGEDYLEAVEDGSSLHGGDGEDILMGKSSNDSIWGDAGEDFIDAGAGDDNLYGDTGNDTIYGQDGNDLLTGGEGNDYLYGGKGNDSISGGDGNDIIFGEAGDDILAGGKGSDIINSGKGINTFIYNLGDGKDTLIVGHILDSGLLQYNWGWKAIQDWNGSYWSDGGRDAFDSFGVTTLSIGGVSSEINFGLADGVTRETVVAGNTFATRARFLSDNILELYIKQNDENVPFSIIAGGNLGSDGNEQFEVRTTSIGGVEVQYAHSKDLSASDPDVYLFIIPENSVNGTVNYTRNRDNIFGSTQDISGAVRILIIPTYHTPQEIDDLLWDGLYTQSNNTLCLGDGITPDSVSIYRAGSDLVLKFQDDGEVKLEKWYDGHQLESIKFSNGTVWDAANVESNVELPVTDGPDELYGTDGSDTIDGLGGEDVIYGLAGDDTLKGGEQNDTLYGGKGDDTLFGGSGNNTFIGGLGNDTIVVESGDNSIVYNLGDGTDTVISAESTLVRNYLKLGEGIWQYLRILRNDNDLSIVISENEKIIISGWYLNNALAGIEFADGIVWTKEIIEGKVRLPGEIYEFWGTDEFDVMHGTEGKDEMHGLGGFDVFYGYGGDDTIDGGGNGDVVYGGSGNDLLKNAAVLYGEAGDDVLHSQETGSNYMGGGEGNDILYGCDLYDNIYGDAGNDQLFGRLGDDYLNGGAGDDMMDGGSGNDDFFGGDGNDIIYAWEGNNDIWGDLGDDLIYGGGGDDYIYGGDGNDTIYGGDGNDVLYSNDGNGFIDGGEGNDTVYGGYAGSTIYAGAGNDTIFQNSASLVCGGTGNDTFFLSSYDGDIISGGSGDDLYDVWTISGVAQINDYDTTAGNTDTVRLSYNPADIVFAQDGEDLVVKVVNTANQLEVTGWYNGIEQQTEVFMASDGTKLLSTQVNQLIQAMSSFTESTGIDWSEAVSQRREEAMQVLAQYWTANV